VGGVRGPGSVRRLVVHEQAQRPVRVPVPERGQRQVGDDVGGVAREPPPHPVVDHLRVLVLALPGQHPTRHNTNPRPLLEVAVLAVAGSNPGRGTNQNYDAPFGCRGGWRWEPPAQRRR
jgi:hypothetical protein